MTSISALTLRARSRSLTLDDRDGVYLPALMLLEDGSGYWLFEDGARIMAEAGDTGTTYTLRRRRGYSVPALMILEDETGYWQFEDDDLMMAEEGDTGTSLTLPEK